MFTLNSIVGLRGVAIWTLQISLLLVLSIPLVPAQVGEPAQSLLQSEKLHPALLEMSSEEPGQIVRVIALGSGTLDAMAHEIAALGGDVVRELAIINGLVVDIEAQDVPRLAQSPNISRVSPDAPTLKSAEFGEGEMVLQEQFSRRNGIDSVNWNWFEVGEEDGFEAGDIATTLFLGGTVEGLRMQTAGKGIQTSVDLELAGRVTLSLAYRRKGFASESDAMRIEVSQDGGVSWQLIERLAGPVSDPLLQIERFDLSAYAAPQTSIRIIGEEGLSSRARFYIDYVQLNWELDQIYRANQLVLPYVSGGNSAPRMSAATAGQFVRDEFNSISYANNDGTVDWAGDWIEIGESNGVTSDDVQVTNFPGGSSVLGLRVREGEGAMRQVDLSGVSSATLNFEYRLVNFDSHDWTTVEVSSDGGASWTELVRYDESYGDDLTADTFDISAYASANTFIRFMPSESQDSGKRTFFKNVEVVFDGSGDPSPSFSGAGIVLDEFSVQSYGNNDGNVDWLGPWIEVDDNGSPSGGDITVEVDDCPDRASRCVEFDSDADEDSYIERGVDLTGAESAVLTFDYYKDDSDGEFELEVSSNNGPWIELEEYRDEEKVFGESFDLTPYISANTRIRFRLADRDSGAHYYIDNVQIEYGCGDCIDTSNLSSTYTRAISAHRLWNKRPRRQGKEVTVAVLDSGIADHPDLMDSDGSRVIQRVDFTGGEGQVDDFYGHGTHVAGAIAGDGERSNGSYIGVAPKAKLIDVKVTDDFGAGSTSDVVAGLEWVLMNKDYYNIRVVNMSLNSTMAESYHDSPLDLAVEILWFNGIVVVVSSGNNGDDANADILYAPANDPFVITVGAVDDMGTEDRTDDQLSAFTAHGVTADGFHKPEIFVPGSDIIAPLAADDANLALDHPSHTLQGPDGSYYFRMSGTSMASAIAAGAVALLVEDEPQLTPDQVKHRLMASGTPFMNGTYIDIEEATDGESYGQANQGVMPHMVLARMALMAYWASQNGGENIDWSNLNWSSVNWNSVNWNSVNWNSVMMDDQTRYGEMMRGIDEGEPELQSAGLAPALYLPVVSSGN